MDAAVFSGLLYNPLITNTISATVVASVLGLTSANSPIRLGVLFILVAWTSTILPYSQNGVSRNLYASILASQSLGICLQYLDMGLLSRWSYAAQGPTSALGGQHSLRSETTALQKVKSTRLSFMLDAICEGRRVGTPWEVKQTPPFSATVPSFVPSRRRFLCTTALRLGVCLIILDLASLAGADPTQNAVVFALSNVPVFSRWRNVTGREITMRIGTSLAGWLINYCVLEAMYDVLAIVFVAVGLSEVRAWRPIFGPIRECWSIRQFWGSFWHQVMRQRLSAPANLVTYHILCLRKHTLRARYVFLFTAFAVSGLFHGLSDLGAGIKWEENLAMRFFVTQALGIMFEDGVQMAFRACTAKWRVGQQRLMSMAFGYAWVVIWMAWTSPAFFYPKMSKQTASEWDELLPFSMLKITW